MNNTVQYGSGGLFKIQTFITHLSYSLFENNFSQNHGICIGVNCISSVEVYVTSLILCGLNMFSQDDISGFSVSHFVCANCTKDKFKKNL